MLKKLEDNKNYYNILIFNLDFKNYLKFQ